MTTEENRRKNHNTPQLTQAGVILSHVLSRGPLGELHSRYILFSNAEKLFGKLLAAHLQIVDLKGSILVLKASNSVWKTESEYRKKAIIDRCNGLLGAPCVKGIRFI